MPLLVLRIAFVQAGQAIRGGLGGWRRNRSSAHRSGFTPEMLDEAGYSVPAIIEKHLAPKLEAKETKFFAHEGKVVSTRQVDDHSTQMRAIENILEMHGAYAPKDLKEADHFGVKVIVVDIPRPRYTLPDIKPGDPLPTMEEIIAMQPENNPNGHKPQE